MKIEELLLTAGEASHVDSNCGVDAHSLERRTMRDRRDDERDVVFEPYKSTIEEVINSRGQQQSVFTVESFFVVRVAPRLAMARDQVNGIFDAGKAAFRLDLAYPLFE